MDVLIRTKAEFAPLVSNELTEDPFEDLPKPATLQFRLHVGVNYIIGSFCFFIGSIEFLKAPEYYAADALFGLGGAFYLLATVEEWFTVNRIGCMYYEDYATDYEQIVGNSFGYRYSVLGQYLRMENGLNSGLSAFAYLTYIMTASLFFDRLQPVKNAGIATASLIVLASQIWKICRIGMRDNSNLKSRIYKLANFTKDMVVLLSELFLAVGAIFYAGGGVLIISYDSWAYIPGIVIWIMGGTCYVASACLYAYRLVYTENRPLF